MTKNLQDLPNDIYALFNPDEDHVLNEENLSAFLSSMEQTLRSRLAKAQEQSSPLRFSALGKPDRQLWYDGHPDGEEEKLSTKTLFRFLYGDVIENLLVFLIKEAGHTVEREQEEIEVAGVKGHIDCLVDGVVVDIKSASPFGFKKFKENSVTEDDPFGYVAQLSGYAAVLTPDKSAAWIAMDKVSGEICVSSLSNSIIQDYPPEPRIEHLKEVLDLPEPPARCYEDEPDGKSGNRKLGTACSYCKHKARCWPGLRGFFYAGRPRFLTEVARTPDVMEFEVGKENNE